MRQTVNLFQVGSTPTLRTSEHSELGMRASLLKKAKLSQDSLSWLTLRTNEQSELGMRARF